MKMRSSGSTGMRIQGITATDTQTTPMIWRNTCHRERRAAVTRPHRTSGTLPLLFTTARLLHSPFYNRFTAIKTHDNRRIRGGVAPEEAHLNEVHEGPRHVGVQLAHVLGEPVQDSSCGGGESQCPEEEDGEPRSLDSPMGLTSKKRTCVPRMEGAVGRRGVQGAVGRRGVQGAVGRQQLLLVGPGGVERRREETGSDSHGERAAESPASTYQWASHQSCRMYASCKTKESERFSSSPPTRPSSPLLVSSGLGT
ncbi:hypothetical protein EYF80_028244 [Liparis tanakae]|uniref:Uncharacterized protein n=1 Tax=Liparis tanakae TaxID=230148 RepID=A0A4Z2H6T5_9TELE|nr:hypothetical protein EYF80_028244 [Liparis tanakae]